MRKRRFKSNSGSEQQQTGFSETGQAVRSADSTPEYLLNTLAVAPGASSFVSDDPTTEPEFIFRLVDPASGFTRGFSNTEGPSSQDPWAATDTTVTDPTGILYPVTPIALAVEKDFFPLFTDILSSGTGYRQDVSFSEFIRHQAMLMDAYQIVLQAVQMNKLAYHFDWTKVPGSNGFVPTPILQAATDFGADDVGLAEYWRPRLVRLEEAITFKHLVHQIRRALTPLYTTGLIPKLIIPVIASPADGAWDVTTMLQTVDDYLDYLRIKLRTIRGVFQTFWPVKLGECQPWDLPNVPVVDLDLESAIWNSGCQTEDTFGDTGDPKSNNALVFDNAEGDTVIYYSMHQQIAWPELRNATLWHRTDSVTDDEYWQMSLHRWDKALIIDDLGGVTEWKGQGETVTDYNSKWRAYGHSRYSFSNVTWGRTMVGRTGVQLHKSAVDRMIRLEVEYLFQIRTLRSILTEIGGSSLRELRTIFQGLIK